ncbi:MAG TPA: multidrug efflux SMR transporter [Rhodothermales bacterium]|nr:multidrug efflux SMR transporter [Rhodothermales bacterium]
MSANTAWLVLFVSGLFETVWAVGVKYTDGFTRLWPSVGVIAAMAVSVYGLSLAARVLPIGTAYAVWTGIGAVGAVLVGLFWLGEPRSAVRLACLALIVAGVAGLKLAGEAPAAPTTDDGPPTTAEGR